MRNHLKNHQTISLALLSGAAFGLISCFNTPLIFGVWFFLPLVWLAFPNRWYAAIFISAFYFSFAWEIVPDVFIYCGRHWQFALMGLGLWSLAGTLPVLPWLLCFPPRPYRLSFLVLCLSTLFVLLTVPPFGILIWGNPLTSAGVLYPGFKWCGLILDGVLMISMAVCLYIKTYRYSTFFIAMCLWSICLYANWVFPGIPHPPTGWVAVNSSSRFVIFPSYLQALVREQIKAGQQVIILPENTVDLYAIRHHPSWKKLQIELHQAHTSLLAGAYAAQAPGYFSQTMIFPHPHQEGVVIINQNQEHFYEARQPLPIVSWHPLGQTKVAAHWGRTGVYSVQGHRVGVFICFEDFLSWLMIMTALGHPDILISIANHWWNMPTAIHKQLNIFQLWGRLFNLPVLMAENTY